MKLRDKDTKKYLLSVAVSTFVSYVVTFISFYGRVYYDIIETTCVCICLLNVVTALLAWKFAKSNSKMSLLVLHWELDTLAMLPLMGFSIWTITDGTIACFFAIIQFILLGIFNLFTVGLSLAVYSFIQHKCKNICLITLYAFTYILYSCSMEQEYNSFNIIYCKEVSSGLQCNNSCGTIEYRGEKYTIKKSAYYVKKELQNVDVYRSDGIISYTKSEVESDKKLANYLGIPLVRIVVISKDKLLDNNTLFSYEAKGDSIFVNQAKNLVIYVNSIQK